MEKDDLIVEFFFKLPDFFSLDHWKNPKYLKEGEKKRLLKEPCSKPFSTLVITVKNYPRINTFCGNHYTNPKHIWGEARLN